MDEKQLRDRFAELREDDLARAPGFARSSARATTRNRSRAKLRPMPLAIAATAVVAIGAVWVATARPFSRSTLAPTIVTWRAPTDVYLRTPGSELFGSMPALRASVLDKMISLPSNRGI